jgi:hypothetical protein
VTPTASRPTDDLGQAIGGCEQRVKEKPVDGKA